MFAPLTLIKKIQSGIHNKVNSYRRKENLRKCNNYGHYEGDRHGYGDKSEVHLPAFTRSLWPKFLEASHKKDEAARQKDTTDLKTDDIVYAMVPYWRGAVPCTHSYCRHQYELGTRCFNTTSKRFAVGRVYWAGRGSIMVQWTPSPHDNSCKDMYSTYLMSLTDISKKGKSVPIHGYGPDDPKPPISLAYSGTDTSGYRLEFGKLEKYSGVNKVLNKLGLTLRQRPDYKGVGLRSWEIDKIIL